MTPLKPGLSLSHTHTHSKPVPDEDGTEDLYDDVNQIQPRPPVSAPPPITSPPLPSGPPPTIRPPPPPVDAPEANYETDPSLQQNGVNHME